MNISDFMDAFSKVDIPTDSSKIKGSDASRRDFDLTEKILSGGSIHIIQNSLRGFTGCKKLKVKNIEHFNEKDKKYVNKKISKGEFIIRNKSNKGNKVLKLGDKVAAFIKSKNVEEIEFSDGVTGKNSGALKLKDFEIQELSKDEVRSIQHIANRYIQMISDQYKERTDGEKEEIKTDKRPKSVLERKVTAQSKEDAVSEKTKGTANKVMNVLFARREVLKSAQEEIYEIEKEIQENARKKDEITSDRLKKWEREDQEDWDLEQEGLAFEEMQREVEKGDR